MSTHSPVKTGKINLYPHQVKAICRMPDMETNGKGGVLAFCPGLGKTITMASHLKHMKEIEDIRRSRSDLIVCPVAVLSHWKSEILSIHTDFKPKILVYHGTKRKRSRIKKKWDYIITTYDMLKSTINGEYEINKKRFTRIILDEAHNIKNGSQKKCPAVARAAFDFSKKSKYRWCITGTPFNNSIMDLASLAMFIGRKGYTDPDDWKIGNIDVNEWRENNVIIMRKDGLLKPPLYHDMIVTPTDRESKIMDSLRDVAGKQFEKWMEAEGQDRIKEQGTLLVVAKLILLMMASMPMPILKHRKVQRISKQSQHLPTTTVVQTLLKFLCDMETEKEPGQLLLTIQTAVWKILWRELRIEISLRCE